MGWVGARWLPKNDPQRHLERLLPFHCVDCGALRMVLSYLCNQILRLVTILAFGQIKKPYLDRGSAPG